MTQDNQLTTSNNKKKLRRKQRLLVVRKLFRNKLLLSGSIILILITLTILIAPAFLKFDAYEMIVTDRLTSPNSKYLLGTDEFGRDVLSRIVYGAQISLFVGASVAIISSIIGLVIGLTSSYYKVMDHILMRICDSLMAIPGILLAIALMAAWGASTRNVIIALSIVLTPQIARIVRSKALSIQEELFIEAMKAQGASTLRIMVSHITPNTFSVLIVQATFIFAESIITEAALSFLGAGVPTPAPSLGNILHDGKVVIFDAWWMTVFPGLIIILIVVGLNFFGDGLRDAIDPHTQPKIKKPKVNIFKKPKISS